MTRNVLPFAASALLALAGLPAFAAELGDEEAPALDDASSSVELTPSADQAPQADARAERRGGGRQGGAKASSQARGGARGHAAPRQGPAAQGPGRSTHAPAAHAPAAHAPAARAPAARPSAPAAQRPAAQGAGAQRPAAQRPAATHAASSARSGHDPRPGTHHVQAGNGPRAANAHAAPGHRGPSSGAHRPDPKPGHQRPAAGRKPHHVVHHHAGVPPRWAPSYHRYHLRGVPRYAPRYWAAGVFVYSPPPPRHRVVVVDGAGKRVADAEPTRAVDRNQSFSVGLRGGSYMSGYQDGGGYGDLGLGLAVRYRPVEAVGLELSWMHHSDTWDDQAERAEDPLSASVQLFAFPWTRVSPYVFTGITVTPREADDTYYNGLEYTHYQANDALAGPHLGLGIEFAVGKQASIGFDGKYVGYIDRQDGDATYPGAFQGSMGLNMYF